MDQLCSINSKHLNPALILEKIQTVYGRLFPLGDANRFCDHVFRVYDADGDGVISFVELLTTLQVFSNGSVDDKLRAMFRMYDIDRNGFVTVDEITHILAVRTDRRMRVLAGSYCLDHFLPAVVQTVVSKSVSVFSMAPHIRSHRAPCSRFPTKVSLQLSSEQSVCDVRITQLDWKRVPAAAKVLSP